MKRNRCFREGLAVNFGLEEDQLFPYLLQLLRQIGIYL
jgi:hypothetical protein